MLESGVLLSMEQCLSKLPKPKMMLVHGADPDPLDEVVVQAMAVGGLEIRELDFSMWAVRGGGLWYVLNQKQASAFLLGYIRGFEKGTERSGGETVPA